MESFGPLTLPKPPVRLRGPVAASGTIPVPPPPVSPAPPASQGQGPDAQLPPALPLAAAPAQPSAGVAQSELADATATITDDAAVTPTLPSDAEIAALLGGVSPGQASPAVRLTDDEIAAGRQTLNENGVGIVNGKPIWQCAHCDHLQPMTNFVCGQCGTRFGAPRLDPVAHANYKRMEMMFPGYGFFQAGHQFIALTRILVTTSWLATAMFVAYQRPIVALPLIAGVGVLWALGPQDLEQVLLGHEPRLNGRGLLILITLVLLAFIFVGAADFYLGTSGLNQ